jgi:hypothetical protein
LEFVAKEADATQAVLSLASKTLDEAGYRNWLCANIVGWVKRMTTH